MSACGKSTQTLDTLIPYKLIILCNTSCRVGFY